MKKHVLISMIFLVLGYISIQAQVIIEEMDALNYSRTQLKGTARYMSMGGAFTSLGGDISSVTQNPAGIAVYRSNELATTLGLNFINTNAKQEGTSNSEGITKFSFNNFGYIGTAKLKNSGSGIMNWNFGFVYNRAHSFDRNYRTAGNVSSNASSLSDYIAERTNLITNRPSFDQLNNGLTSYNQYPWLSVLGAQGSLIYQADDDFYYGNFRNAANQLKNASLEVSERGYIDEYNFALGFNYSNMLYAGLDLGITDFYYDAYTYYDEVFQDEDGFGLDNYLQVDGSGVNVKLGVIFRPDYNWRIGLAYHSPTFYDMTTTYDGYIYNYNANYGDTGTPGTEPGETYPVTKFSLRTPQKLLLGTSYIFGNGLISLDYEFCDYSTIKIKRNGYDETPNYLSEDFQASHSIKIGGEYNLSRAWSLRAGYAHITSPIKKEARDVELFKGGTDPNYTVDKSQNYFSLGFGYKYQNMFVDMAYVLHRQSEDVYPFAPVMADDPEYDVTPTVSSMTTNRNSILLTLGFKF